MDIEKIRDFYTTMILPHGPTFSGGLFGLGCWFWLDAVVVSKTSVPFVQYLPGIIATIGLILINAVKYDDIQGYEPWGDDGVYCRSRVWLLIAYGVCAGAALGAVAVMISQGASFLGIACVLQVTCILASALLFYVSNPGGENDTGYTGF